VNAEKDLDEKTIAKQKKSIPSKLSIEDELGSARDLTKMFENMSKQEFSYPKKYEYLKKPLGCKPYKLISIQFVENLHW